MEESEAVSSRHRRWSVVSVLALAVVPWSIAMPDAALNAAPAQEPRIEITIRDFSYVRTKMQPIRAGMPMVLVIRNEDPVRHGFISPMFAALHVRAEGEGVEVFGKGIEGFHLDPGKTLVIRLTPDRQGKMTFRCDLHPNVEGELYLLEVPVG